MGVGGVLQGPARAFPFYALLHPLGSLPGPGWDQRKDCRCLVGLWLVREQGTPPPLPVASIPQPHKGTLHQLISGGRFITNKL